MAETTLTPSQIDVNSATFRSLLQWRFDDAFEAEFVARTLADDIPQRVLYDNGVIWVYLDEGQNIVAFGTLCVCEDYAAFTEGKHHAYIPLLAVHPEHRGKKYGRAVVKHLVEEAACVVQSNAAIVHASVFLDVYEQSAAALSLYQKSGFAALGHAIVDPANGKAYRIMAKRVAT